MTQCPSEDNTGQVINVCGSEPGRILRAGDSRTSVSGIYLKGPECCCHLISKVHMTTQCTHGLESEVLSWCLLLCCSLQRQRHEWPQCYWMEQYQNHMTRKREQQVLVLCSYNSFTDQRHRVNAHKDEDWQLSCFYVLFIYTSIFATDEVPNLSDKVTLRVILVRKG